MDVSCGKVDISCGKVDVFCGKVDVSCGKVDVSCSKVEGKMTFNRVSLTKQCMHSKYSYCQVHPLFLTELLKITFSL